MADPWYLRIIAGPAWLLIGFGTGVLVRKIARKVLQHLNVNRAMLRLGFPWNIESGVSAILSFIIYVATIYFFLDQLQITLFVSYIGVGGLAILVALSLFVFIKDFLPNFWAWFLLRRQKKVGEKVAWNEISGVIIHRSYLETRLRTPRGDTLYVPNSLLLEFVRQ